MIATMIVAKKRIIFEKYKPEEFTVKMLGNLKRSSLVGLDLYFSKKADDPLQFKTRTKIIEEFLDLNPGTVMKYLEQSYRPSISQEGATSIITLPYFSTIAHVRHEHAERFIPIVTLIVGFFGMNFFNISGIDLTFSIIIAFTLIVALIVPLLLLWRFKMFKKIEL
ncbi:MAG: hypothetical protein ACTSQQ_04835 [Candidatus Helarchaeota archaeon]